MPAHPPRALRLLRIDDDLHGGLDVVGAPQYPAQKVFRHLDTVSVHTEQGPLAGIDCWSTAITFWSNYEDIGPIDLIVSDVRFLDKTSPLARLTVDGPPLPLPTGLSHFKPFAAIARASGRPLGIGLHTKDPTIWERFWRNPDREGDVNLRFMSLLAAHEIGELAAIMGEADELMGTDAEACWDWLQKFAVDKPIYECAVPIALSQYRRGLSNTHVLPVDWRALLAWCTNMREAATSSGEGVGPLLSVENDPGIVIFGDDGRRDAISIRSIFADVPPGKQGFDFDLVSLPARSFTLGDDDSYFELDGEGYPKIGALVMKLGSLAHDYEKALEILAYFPELPEGDVDLKLTDVKSQLRATNLATALAILLQDVRREHIVSEEWSTFYQSQEWDPSTNMFTGQESLNINIKGYLERILKAWKHNDVWHIADVVTYFHCSDVSIDPDQGNPPSANFCLELLRELGLATRAPNTDSYSRTNQSFSPGALPPFPKTPPRGFFSHSRLGKAYSFDEIGLNDPSKILRILFGYESFSEGPQKSGNAVLERQIGQAFGWVNSDGTKFLEAFREGRAPEWLKELCRDYARDPSHLNWADPARWPKSIR